mgnify:CR=1 FL=1
MGTPFLSEMRIVGFNFAPRGWTLCDGQLLPIAQNQALFSLLGTMYGGDGRTTFALPDMRGRAPLHTGRGAGLSPHSQGNRGGAQTVTLTTSELPSHNHFMRAGNDNVNHAPGAHFLGSNVPLYHTGSTVGTNLNSTVLANTGGGGAHNNEQPALGLYFIIATTGVFPSRN